MIAFIDEHRCGLGVEPICKHLPIAPSTYYDHQAKKANPDLLSKRVKTTMPDKAHGCPLDKVNRQFQAPAPTMLWVADFTYLATWQGFVYVAFVLEALEQAVYQRRPDKGLVHHSDRGSQYLSIKYSERLAEAEIEPSVGSVGDS